MCLAIPGKLVSINEDSKDLFREGTVSFDGIKQKVNLSLLPEAKVGDFILVHVGVAIGVVDADEAEKTLSYLKRMGEA